MKVQIVTLKCTKCGKTFEHFTRKPCKRKKVCEECEHDKKREYQKQYKRRMSNVRRDK